MCVIRLYHYVHSNTQIDPRESVIIHDPISSLPSWNKSQETKKMMYEHKQKEQKRREEQEQLRSDEERKGGELARDTINSVTATPGNEKQQQSIARMCGGRQTDEGTKLKNGR